MNLDEIMTYKNYYCPAPLNGMEHGIGI